MKSLYEKTTQESSEQQQREADMATRRRSPALCVGTNPRSVIRGESLLSPHIPRPESHPYSAHTDWLSCTFPLADREKEIRKFFDFLSIILGTNFGSIQSNNRGIHGWTRCFSISDTHGLFAIGGQRGRAYLQFKAETCALISFSGWGKFCELMNTTYDGRITRWDGAADDLLGIHSIEWAIDQLHTGGFSTGGNKPQINQAGDWITKPEYNGRTLYLGSRKNGKLLRIYEKGKQLGERLSPWTRWEIELRNKDREIPWDVLLLPGQYVAGAHKCMNWIDTRTSRIETHKKATKISELALISHCRNAYGPLINHLTSKYDDSDEILKMLLRSGKPKRLSASPPPD